ARSGRADEPHELAIPDLESYLLQRVDPQAVAAIRLRDRSHDDHRRSVHDAPSDRVATTGWRLSRHPLEQIPSTHAATAIAITTAPTTQSIVGATVPRSAISEGIAKDRGTQITAATPPAIAPTSAIAIPSTTPGAKLRAGEKPRALSTAY